MDDEGLARAFFAATSAIVTFGLVLQLIVSITADPGTGYFESTPDRIVNFFSFFTVLSNIAVAATTGLLAIRLDRRSVLFRTLRLDGLLAITVTGVVFHLTLSDLQELTGWSAFADFLLHTLSPSLNVQEHGYPVVLDNVSIVAVLFLAISFGALALDRRLRGVRAPAA